MTIVNFFSLILNDDIGKYERLNFIEKIRLDGMLQDMNTEEEEASNDGIPKRLEDVPAFFYSATQDECLSEIFDSLPNVFDPSFKDALNHQIDVAESSISLVTEVLTAKVMNSQNSIFDATDRFISLHESVVRSTNFIESMRSEVDKLRNETLNPLLTVYTQIRDLRREMKTHIVLHFIDTIVLILEALSSDNYIWSAYTYTQASSFLNRDSEVYSIDMLDQFIDIKFPPILESVSQIPSKLTLRELKRAHCIQQALSDIRGYKAQMTNRMNEELDSLTQKFNNERYSMIIIAYCLLHPEPPIPFVVFSAFSNQIRKQSMKYFESQSNDLSSLFRFMENSCLIISGFKWFTDFHEKFPNLSSIISELSIDINLLLLEKLPSDREMSGKLSKIRTGFETNYDNLCHVAESNVLQFLSRIKCTTLDALSFIQLTRALREFTHILSCEGLIDWINLTATEFLTRYASVVHISVKTSITNDTWVPFYPELEFISLVKSMPSDEIVFFAETGLDAMKTYASQSAITTVRIIHSLMCLSLELDFNTCANLIIQVTLYFIFSILNTFAYPITLMSIEEPTKLSTKICHRFDPQYVVQLKNMVRMWTHSIALPDQKQSTGNESHLMQMATATEGFHIIKWYLSGIKDNLLSRANSSNQDKLNRFFNATLTTLLPLARRNLSSIGSKNFLNLKSLKYQIMATNWIINEVTIECHQFVVLAKKAFDNLAKALSNLQLQKSVREDIWRGAWFYVRCMLLSAFGSVRACNAFGRNLMIGDTKAVSIYFSNVSKIEADNTPILEFLNSFFFNAGEFSKWLDTTSGRFKPQQLANLVRTGLNCKLNAKDTKDLLTKIDSFTASNSS